MGKKKTENTPGGFMAIYHDIEEICYGPELGLSAKERVFLCIRHKLLRDGLCQKLIGKSFIIEKTGLTMGQVKIALAALEKAEIILVHRSMTGKTWNESQYELNPKKFGSLYNWYKNNPTVRVYSGSKKQQGVESDPTPGVGSYSALGVVPDTTPGGDIKLADLLRKLSPKNPLKEPIRKEPLREEINFFSETGEDRDRELSPEELQAEKRRQLLAFEESERNRVG